MIKRQESIGERQKLRGWMMSCGRNKKVCVDPTSGSSKVEEEDIDIGLNQWWTSEEEWRCNGCIYDVVWRRRSCVRV